jgi:hypothetical protein
MFKRVRISNEPCKLTLCSNEHDPHYPTKQTTWTVPDWGYIADDLWHNLERFMDENIYKSFDPDRPDHDEMYQNAYWAFHALEATNIVHQISAHRGGQYIRFVAVFGQKSLYRWSLFDCYVKQPVLVAIANIFNYLKGKI